MVDDGKVAGLLSERDLIGAAANRIFGLKQKSRSALLKSELVKNVMKKRVVAVAPDTHDQGSSPLMAEKDRCARDQ